MAQGDSAPASSASAGGEQGLSRAEVLADLALWHRAGMTYWPRSPSGELNPQQVPDYQAALSRYQQLHDSADRVHAMHLYQQEPGQ